MAEELLTYRCSHPNCGARLTVDVRETSVLELHVQMLDRGWHFASDSGSTVIECPTHRRDRHLAIDGERIKGAPAVGGEVDDVLAMPSSPVPRLSRLRRVLL